MTEYEETLSERIRAVQARIAHLCLNKDKGIDTMRMVQIYAGLSSELMLEYDLPGEMMSIFVSDMSAALSVECRECIIEDHSFPPIYVLDREIEFGRAFAREITMEEWDDVHEALKTLSSLIVHDFTTWEEQGHDREESLSLFNACLKLALSMEFAAQDLCDILIEEKIAKENWTLGDCISAMSGASGWKCGASDVPEPKKRSADHLPPIEQIGFIMTQEAMRLGVEGRRDWRLGLPANDMKVDPPKDLIESVMPLFMKYMQFIEVDNDLHVCAMIAKACGRMMAVAAGGDFPEIEPAIAKPLAMMALHESYSYQDMKKVSALD